MRCSCNTIVRHGSFVVGSEPAPSPNSIEGGSDADDLFEHRQVMPYLPHYVVDVATWMSTYRVLRGAQRPRTDAPTALVPEAVFDDFEVSCRAAESVVGDERSELVAKSLSPILITEVGCLKQMDEFCACDAAI